MKPFFREHFARIDRQVVLVDVLGALARGPRAFEDLRQAMADILGAFNPGRNAWLARLLGQRRVERILFAATKADHLHHAQHARLAALAEALLREARDRAEFAGAETAAMAIAVPADHRRGPGGARRRRRWTWCAGGSSARAAGGAASGRPARGPGAPPRPRARRGPRTGRSRTTRCADFAPAPLTLRPGEGPPHIRLDKAAEFLIGDAL